MNKNTIKRLFPPWAVLPWIAIATFGFLQLAALFPNWIDTLFSQRIYPVVATVFSWGSSFYPFSLDDLFYIFLLVGVVVLLILIFIRKLSSKTAGKLIINSLALIYILFYCLWGFNYFREGLNQRLQLKNCHPSMDDMTRVTGLLVESINASWCNFDDFDKNETDQLIEEGFKKISNPLKIIYPGGKRRSKEITFSRFFAKAGISGYYGPFFSEVHVNSFILPVEYPFVLAHEKAHQFGITNEAEANFYAWLVCSRSSSKQLCYSAYIHALRSFMQQGYEMNMPPETLNGLNEKVKNDYRKIQEHWKSLRNERIDKTASKVYDTYLKTNKVERGIRDYEGIVKYIMDFSNDSEFRGKLNYYKENGL